MSPTNSTTSPLSIHTLSVPANNTSRPLIKLMTVMTMPLMVGLLAGCGNSGATAAQQGNEASNLTTATPATTVSSPMTSVNPANNEGVVAALQANMVASGIEQQITSAVPTDMPGMYWVTANGLPNFFTDEQGKYIIQGQVIEIGAPQPVDISASLQAEAARSQLANVPLEDMIIYPALGETKAVVYAFTDADCGYCRKLHSEMQDINANGIEVRYLAWPRSEQTVPKMEAIWCSDDRNFAMNTAKAGGQVSAPACDSPVSQQVDLGFSLGVNGTPALYTTSGTNIGGYLPATQLAQAAIANQ